MLQFAGVVLALTLHSPCRHCASNRLRAGAISIVDTDVVAAQELLVKSLLYNRKISDAGLDLIEQLVEAAPPVAGDAAIHWWLGRFQLCSSYQLAGALRDNGKWRMLESGSET